VITTNAPQLGTGYGLTSYGPALLEMCHSVLYSQTITPISLPYPRYAGKERETQAESNTERAQCWSSHLTKFIYPFYPWLGLELQPHTRVNHKQQLDS